jgi:hypothetical protein
LSPIQPEKKRIVEGTNQGLSAGEEVQIWYSYALQLDRQTNVEARAVFSLLSDSSQLLS